MTISRRRTSAGVARFEKVLHGLYDLCGALAACAIVMIALLVGASVMSRFLGIYVGGLTEAAGYCMAAAGSLGLAHTFGSGGHIRVDLGLNALPSRVRTRVDQLAMLATTAVVLYLAWYLVRMVSISWKFGDLSDGSDALPLWLPQLPAAFGFVVFAMALIHGSIRYVLTGKSPVDDSGPGFLTRKQGD